MQRTIRIIAAVVLLAVFISSVIMLIRRNADYKEGEKEYQEAAELVQLPDLSELPVPEADSGTGALLTEQEPEQQTGEVYVDPYADALRNMDFSALRQVNSDVLGWMV